MPEPAGVNSGTARPAPVAVLGATGFIGRHLCTALARRGIAATAIVRRNDTKLDVSQRTVADFSDPAALRAALDGAASVVHLADEAGRFGAPDGKPPIAQSLGLALADSHTRLIFASSIYARLDEEGQPNSYGARKRDQEEALIATGCAVGLRLPPVYGEGCGGSFALLERAIALGIPLPLGLASAPRSFLSVSNLCALVITLLEASKAAWDLGAPALYEPEDARRLSSRDLAQALASDHGRSARLLPIPRILLAAVASLIGRSDLLSGAFDPLAARGNPDLYRIFGWQPSADSCSKTSAL